MKNVLSAIFLIFILFSSNNVFSAEGNGKSFGIAVNPALLPLKWLSLDLCFWNIDRDTEINIPFQFTKNPSLIMPFSADMLYLSGGMNFRRFFNGEQNGFFAELGFQYNYFDIEFDDDKDSSADYIAKNPSILCGVGYRLITVNNFFWGCDFAIGRQWGKESYVTSIGNFNYSINIFKFGYAF